MFARFDTSFANAIQTAAETATEHGAAAAHHGNEVFYQTAPFWVAVGFLIVVGFAYKKVARAIGNGLDLRAEKIKATIEEARQLREEAQNLLAEYQRKQRDALKEADEIVAHAREEAKRLMAEAEVALEESVKRREKQAKDRITQAQNQAEAEVRSLAVDLAISATRKVMAEGLTAAKASALIDDAVKELPGRLN